MATLPADEPIARIPDPIQPAPPSPPSPLDLAARADADSRLTAAVQTTARKYGMEPDKLFELVRSGELRPIDYGDAFGRYGITGREIDALREMVPSGAPARVPPVTRGPVTFDAPVPAPSSAAPSVTRTYSRPTITWSELERSVRRAGRGLTGPDAKAYESLVEEIRAKYNPSGDPKAQVPYTVVHKVARRVNDIAKKAFAAAKAGGEGAARGEAAKLMAGDARSALTTRVPGLAQQNAQTQRLAAVAQALEDAPFRRNVVNMLHSPIVAVPASAAGAMGLLHHDPSAALAMTGLGTLAAMNRPAASRVALFVGRSPVAQGAIRQLPRAAEWAIGSPLNPSRGAFGEAKPDATGEFILDDE